MKHRVAAFVSLSAFVTFVTACEHSGSHTHEPAGQAAAPAELEPATVTVFGERTLLFMEHPPLVPGVAARFLAHLTVAATGEPVRAGRVVLEIGGTSLSVDAPKRDGLFVPEGTLPAAGTFSARLVVTSEQVQETLELGQLHVYASVDDARRAAAAEVGAAAPNEVPFLMEQQWKVKLLLAEARPTTLSRRLVLPARARVPEGSAASVSAGAAGRLLAPAGGKLPRTGDRVTAGQLLGFVEPPLVSSDLAQLQAQSLDFDLRVLDVTRAIREAEARLRFAERERERVATLRAEGLGTQQQLDQAEQSVVVARSDEQAARATKESLDRLVAERAARNGGAGTTAVRLPLHAPIAGVVVAAQRVEGESVPADAELYRILDSARLWIEGRASEFDLAHVRTAPAAFVSFPALPGMHLDLSAAAVAGAYVAPQIDAESRTFAVRYELPNASGELKDGMLAQLSLVTARADAAVAIPADAVISEQGLPTAYVMLAGETFEKRELELGIRDGEFVEVLRGIAPGERVATRGAYVVKLAALSPASFGHGHAH